VSGSDQSISQDSKIKYFTIVRDELNKKLANGEITEKTYVETISRRRKKAIEAGLTEAQVEELFPRKKSGPAKVDGGARNQAKSESLPIASIGAHLSNQMRADGIDPTVRAEYAALIRSEGWIFPPVVVFRDGDDFFLADGFHRHAAAIDEALKEIPADIREGSSEDALLFACGANAKHGKRRTRKDVRFAIRRLLQCEKWEQASDKWISEQVGCDDHTVASVRLDLESDAKAASSLRNSEASLTGRTRPGQQSHFGISEVNLADPSAQVPDFTQNAPPEPADSESEILDAVEGDHLPRADLPAGRHGKKQRKTRDGRTISTVNIGKKKGPNPAVVCEQQRMVIVAALAQIRAFGDGMHPSDALTLCTVLRDGLVEHLHRLAESDRARIIEGFWNG